MSEQGFDHLPPSEAPQVYADWPAPVVPSAPVHESAPGMNRRAFVIGGAAAGLFAVAGGTALAARAGLIDRILDPINEPESPVSSTPFEVADRNSSATENGKKPETSAYRTKEEYSLADLSEYARTTDFAENDPAALAETVRQIENAKDRRQLEELSKAAVLRMTGRELYFNRLPGTEETLPNTRPNTDLGFLSSNMGKFIQRLGTLPRQLVSRPSDYNIIEDFLPSVTSDGRASVDPNIGGQVLHKADSDHLSMDVNTLGDFSTLAHELMHVGQFLVGADDYTQSSPYSLLRAEGARQFGSVQDMHIALESKRGAELAMGNSSFNQVADLAYNLIRSEDSAPDVRVEDEAYTIGATIRMGLLPDMPDDELLTYLRNKQLQAMDDMSVLAGVDFGAVLAFGNRFTDTTHPKTLASVAESGALDQMSPLEGGPLAADEPWKSSYLSPGSHFVNIGSLEQPELVLLIATGTEIDPVDPTEAYGLYDLYLVTEYSDESLDLREVPPTTTTLPPSEMTDPEIGVEIPVPMLTSDEQFVQDIVQIFAPELKVNQDFQANADIDPAAYGKSTGKYNVRVELDAGVTYRSIDRTRLFGRINDARLFELF